MSIAQHQPGKGLEADLTHKREKIYPRMVTGKFALFRASAACVLLGLYYLIPWLSWDGRQAVLFDLPERKFHIFGLIFWPQDFIYLTGFLVIAALSLFFFTALFGRAWCGYACPQTVWTESFLWIERKVEGDRQQQIKLDKMPWASRKIVKKGLKHLLWIAFALWTGFTFVGYFTPIKELALKILTFSTGPFETFWVLFYSLATYGNAGWLREAVCIYMCPYARFQSAMFDKNTLIISYDEKRGEPRGSRKRSADPKAMGLGSCINCSLCVQVCPTGIDIRDGLQYQCISCSSCIDVCDSVMEKMNYPKGLIKYTTENELEGNPRKIIRPRIIIYAVILLTLISVMSASVLTRSTVKLDVLRDRNSLYRVNNQGQVENIYTLKVINKQTTDHEFKIEVNGIDNLLLKMDDSDTNVEAGEIKDVVVRLIADPNDLEQESTTIEFKITALDDDALSTKEQARFLGP